MQKMDTPPCFLPPEVEYRLSEDTIMPAELVVDRDMLESFLPVLGAEVTDDEYIRDIESNEILTTNDGEKLTIDEIGYLKHGSIVPVEDDFSAIVSELSDCAIR